MFRLEILHNVAYGGIPAETFDRLVSEWLELPWWKRPFTPDPRLKCTAVETTSEVVPGEFSALEDADAAAVALAERLSGQLRDDTAIAIVDVADGRWVDGVYLNSGGRF